MSNTWPDGFHERDTAYYAAVGYLCHQWNNVEHFVYGLGSDVMRLERRFHALLFRHLSIKSIQSFLEDYAESHYDSEIFNQIKHINAYVDRCRINRNMIVHGLPSSDPETGMPIIRVTVDKNRKTPKSFPISIKEVRQTCDECETVGMLLVKFQFLVMPESERTRLLDQFFHGANWQTLLSEPPLPKLLVENQHAPLAKRSPPRSSQV